MSFDCEALSDILCSECIKDCNDLNIVFLFPMKTQELLQ